MRENLNEMARFTKLYCCRKCQEKDNKGQSCDVKCWHWLCWGKGFLLECVYWFVRCFNQWKVQIFHKPAHEPLQCYRNTSCPKIHFPEQLVQCHGKGDCFRYRICYAQHLQQLQHTAGNKPAFLFASHPNVSFFSSSIEYSTLTQTLFPQVMQKYFEFLLQIVKEERQFFSPWRHNSCKENMRSRKGTGKVSTKALFAYVNKTKQRLTTGLL